MRRPPGRYDPEPTREAVLRHIAEDPHPRVEVEAAVIMEEGIGVDAFEHVLAELKEDEAVVEQDGTLRRAEEDGSQ